MAENDKAGDAAGGKGDLQDDLDIDVEPPDAEILALEQRRKMTEASDLIGRAETDDGPPPEVYDWGEDFRASFTIKDIFYWTAAIAVALASVPLVGVCGATTVLAVGTFIWLLIASERNHRQRMAAVSQHYLQQQQRAREGQQAREPWQLTFSIADLLIATTIAAVSFALLRVLEGAMAAAILGFLVLTGIVSFWIGMNPPRRLVLAWFILTAMYLVVSALVVIENSTS